MYLYGRKCWPHNELKLRSIEFGNNVTAKFHILYFRSDVVNTTKHSGMTGAKHASALMNTQA